jgi:hypothetical protein
MELELLTPSETSLNRGGVASEPSTFRWREGIERGGAIVYIEARYPDTLTLLADTRFISPDEFEDILRTVERLLVEGVGRNYNPLDLLSDSGIEEAVFDDSWDYLDHSWVNLDSTRQMISVEMGIDDVRVTVVKDMDGVDRLVASLPQRISKGSASAEALRQACFCALPRWRNAMIPHRFIRENELFQRGH